MHAFRPPDEQTAYALGKIDQPGKENWLVRRRNMVLGVGRRGEWTGEKSRKEGRLSDTGQSVSQSANRIVKSLLCRHYVALMLIRYVIRWLARKRIANEN